MMTQQLGTAHRVIGRVAAERDALRQRRQLVALILVGIVLVLWIAGRIGIWQLPDNISKDSLAHLPLVGEIMSYFLAGWVF